MKDSLKAAFPPPAIPPAGTEVIPGVAYWGWREATGAALHVELYRLHALALARPALLEQMTAELATLRETLGARP